MVGAQTIELKGVHTNHMAGESWTLTVRQQRRLAGLKARAELNTPEGQAFRQRIIDSVSKGA